ncbi:MAG: hypothetical protein DLM58_00665 [Pseudonocardiales bacterium]|nr:MAG: hypothetical protein DLM58_00665 [Pseudonocardiales bacterium]
MSSSGRPGERGVFRVLGPLEVGPADTPVTITAGRSRIVLATLLLERGRVVHVDRLISAVWGERSPTTARGQIHICISALRRLTAQLELGELIQTAPAGYRIETHEGMVDVDAFEALTHTATEQEKDGRITAAAETLATALALWRGPTALSDIDSAVVKAAVARLTERRLSVFETYVDLELRTGNAQQVLGPLSDFIAEHPLVEGLRSRLMKALHSLGRRAEALKAYQAARAVLVEELGIEPGHELRELQQAVLRGDADTACSEADATEDPVHAAVDDPADHDGADDAAAALDRPDTVSATGALAPERSVRAADRGRTDRAKSVEFGRPTQTTRRRFARWSQPNLAGYAGRMDELEVIDQVLGRRKRGAQPRVVAVSGMAGIGKSWLLGEAVRRFSADGLPVVSVPTLAADSDATDPATWKAAVLRALARSRDDAALAEQSDADLAEQYAATVPGQVLVVIDDLPAGAQLDGVASDDRDECAFLLAGRWMPGGLPAAATTLRLGGLSVSESTALMDRLTDGQAMLEPSATLAVAERVGGHPAVLEALSVRCREAGAWPALDTLQDADTGAEFLDAVAAGGYNVRAALQASVPAAVPRGAELLHRWPRSTPELRVWAVAQLLDTSIEVAISTLDRLFECGLVERIDGDEGDDANSMATLHALALCLVTEEDDDSALTDRRAEAARRRVLSAWLSLLARATARQELRRPAATPPDRQRTMSPAVVDAVVDDPKEWLEDNRVELESAIGDAASADDELCWQLGTRYMLAYDSGVQREDIAQIVRMAAERSGDRRGETAVLQARADVHIRQGEMLKADAELNAAARLCADLDEDGVEAVLALGRGDVAMTRRHHVEARHEFDLALRIFRGTRAEAGELCAILRQAQLCLAERDEPAAGEWFARASELATRLDSGPESDSEVVAEMVRDINDEFTGEPDLADDVGLGETLEGPA